MAHGLVSLIGLFVIYAPIALIGLVLGTATLIRLAPMLNTKS